MNAACCLCNELSKSLQYNLKNIKSKISNTPLIYLIERVVGVFVTPHFNICLQCYDLINELDAIELRQEEIYKQLKKYIERSTLKSLSDFTEEVIVPVAADNVSNTNINSLPCNSDKKSVDNNPSTTLKLTSDDYFNNKSLNINKEIYENKNKSIEIISAINNKKKGRRKQYPDIAKPHKCHCSKEFKTLWELKNHMNSHSDHRPFVCDICGLSYKYKPSFSRHMDMHNGINPFTCVFCNKSFTQKVALIRHTPLHTGEKPYQCDECGKRFVHHTSFNIHRLSHTGEKSFKCSVCDLALRSSSHLKRHMRIHTGEKRFECDICGRRFAEKYNLAAHKRLHSNPKSTLALSGTQIGNDKKMRLNDVLKTD